MIVHTAEKNQINFLLKVRQHSPMCKLQLDFPAVAINPYSYDQAVSFLSNLFYDEKGNYWTIAVAGFSLSAILPKVSWKTFGKDESVSRMMK